MFIPYFLFTVLDLLYGDRLGIAVETAHCKAFFEKIF